MNIQTTITSQTNSKVRTWLTPLLAGFGGFMAIWILAYARDASTLPLLIPPFGASCVLVFGYPSSPFAHPKNVIGGHLIAALMGLLACAVLGFGPIGMAAGVGLAITAMMLTGTTHPPAGANPIVVALLQADPTFLLTPVLAGAATIVVLGFVYNRLLARMAAAR